MDPQLIAVGLIVAVAAAYVLRRSVRTWAGGKKSGCSGGCGCARVIDAEPSTDALIQIRRKSS